MKKLGLIFVLFSGLANAQFCYNISSPAFVTDPYNTGTNSGLNVDDQFSNAINLPFPFCYDGVIYNQVLISSNAYLSFNLGQAGGFSDYATAGTIPNALPATIRNSILGVWQDLDVSVTGQIWYNTLGVAPNRRFYVAFRNLAYYQCNGQKYFGQIVLYETSNTIDIVVDQQNTCVGWLGGVSIEGLNNAAGGAAFPVAGRNNVSWVGGNDTKRFTRCGAACVVLPIELMNINGVSKEDHNLITWATATEKENDYFAVERSIDGINFTEIERVPGAGNSKKEINYNYKDYITAPGLYYYRLQFVDYNGKKEASTMVAIINQSITKTIVRTLNVMGEPVDENYSGIILIHYSDGSVVKKIKF